MFIFQKDGPAENLHEKKLQLLRNLIWWNPQNSVEFDEEDQVFRDELLNKGVSYCWIAGGTLGIGLWNVRSALKLRKITSNKAWFISFVMTGITSLTLNRLYFALKFEGLEYVAKKYVLPGVDKKPLQK